MKIQSLRRQLDRIDRKLLRLLQQRTSLSGEVGRTKRRMGAEIYVPDRERELLGRVTDLAGDQLPAGAAGAIFREILSSSRAAQGQPPIGVVDRHQAGRSKPMLRWRRDDAASIIRAARCHFGACDKFVIVPNWRELARRLKAGKLSIGLLTFNDLVVAVRDPYAGGLDVVGDFRPSDGRPGLRERLFIVKPKPVQPQGNRALVLIECKATAPAVKTRVNAMPRAPKSFQLLPLPGREGRALTLVSLAFGEPVNRTALEVAGRPVGLILGIYTVDEAHGG